MIKYHYILFLLLLSAACVTALVDSVSLRSCSRRPSVRPTTPRINVAAIVQEAEAPPVDAAVVNRSNDSNGPTVQPVSTWRRRLDTKQDPWDIHKWAGFGWWVSATAIFGTGTLSGFTEAPPVLQSYTYLFLLATLVQAASSVPMAIKYRPHEPSVQRGFISSAIASSSSAVVGVWLSPYHLDETILRPDMVATLIGIFVVTDTLYSMTAFEDVKVMLKNFHVREVDRAKKAQELTKKYSALLPTIPWALPLNLILLHEMVYHAQDMRNYFAVTIAAHGSSLDLVYYASLVTSIAISIGNLAATLRHRKLISKQVEDVALIGSWVVTFVFNLKAAGVY